MIEHAPTGAPYKFVGAYRATAVPRERWFMGYHPECLWSVSYGRQGRYATQAEAERALREVMQNRCPNAEEVP